MTRAISTYLGSNSVHQIEPTTTGPLIRGGEEMLSSTSAFNLRHSEALLATTSSFILQVLLFPLFGNIGS
jgi:hypothetical protein